MTRKEIAEANRKAWNAAAPVHAKSQFGRLLEGFRQPGHSCLDAVETQILTEAIGLKGKAAADRFPVAKGEE